MSDDQEAPRGHLLRVREVAQRLGCSVRHVWRLIDDEEIDTFRHRGLTRISEEALRRYIERNTKEKK
jgi:excisionase family DNA binding protein